MRHLIWWVGVNERRDVGGEGKCICTFRTQFHDVQKIHPTFYRFKICSLFYCYKPMRNWAICITSLESVLCHWYTCTHTVEVHLHAFTDTRRIVQVLYACIMYSKIIEYLSCLNVSHIWLSDPSTTHTKIGS